MGVLEIPCQSDKIISRIDNGRANWIWFSQRECKHKNEILNQFRNGKKLTGKDGLLAPLIKQLTEAALEAEVESHIANDVLSGTRNRKNGVNKKTIKDLSNGSFELETPRDRNGTFEPQIVKKHQTTLSEFFDWKLTHYFENFWPTCKLKKHTLLSWEIIIMMKGKRRWLVWRIG